MKGTVIFRIILIAKKQQNLQKVSFLLSLLKNSKSPKLMPQVLQILSVSFRTASSNWQLVVDGAQSRLPTCQFSPSCWRLSSCWSPVCWILVIAGIGPAIAGFQFTRIQQLLGVGKGPRGPAYRWIACCFPLCFAIKQQVLCANGVTDIALLTSSCQLDLPMAEFFFRTQTIFRK